MYSLPRYFPMIGIFVYDVSALTFSYFLTLLLNEQLHFFFSIDTIILLFVACGSCLFSESYKNVWKVDLALRKNILNLVLTYSIFFILHFVYCSYHLFNITAVCIAFFLSFSFLFLPRIFFVSFMPKKMVEPIIAAGYEEDILNFLIFLKSEPYTIGQILMIGYEGGERYIGNIPLRSIKHIEPLKYLVVVSKLEENDYEDILSLSEKYDMNLLKLEKKVTYPSYYVKNHLKSV